MKMKIAVLILAFASVANAGWFTKDEPEIKVGQTWSNRATGTCYDITFVDEDSVQASCNYNKSILLASDRDYFLEEYKFVTEPKEPEIKVGQIWEATWDRTAYKVEEVGERYVVYSYFKGTSAGYIKIETKEEWREDHELVEEVEPVTSGTIILDDPATVISYTLPCVPTKPYLHKNPTNDHWICSKHGDLMPDYDKDSFFRWDGTATICFYGSKTYCEKCFTETFDKLFSEHITGVEN